MSKLASLMTLVAAAFALTLAADLPGDAAASDFSKPPTTDTSTSSTSDGMVCETDSWGDGSSGGTQTVCYNPDTNDSTWDSSEWGDGYYVSDSGSVLTNSDGSLTIKSKSTDLSW